MQPASHEKLVNPNDLAMKCSARYDQKQRQYHAYYAFARYALCSKTCFIKKFRGDMTEGPVCQASYQIHFPLHRYYHGPTRTGKFVPYVPAKSSCLTEFKSFPRLPCCWG